MAAYEVTSNNNDDDPSYDDKPVPIVADFKNPEVAKATVSPNIGRQAIERAIEIMCTEKYKYRSEQGT